MDVKCNNCNWEGRSSELVSETKSLEDSNYDFCLDCGSDEIEDLEIEY